MAMASQSVSQATTSDEDSRPSVGRWGRGDVEQQQQQSSHVAAKERLNRRRKTQTKCGPIGQSSVLLPVEA